jgi:hypothetical protein
MASRIEGSRETSPIFHAQVSAMIGPTPGTGLKLIHSASKGSRGMSEKPISCRLTKKLALQSTTYDKILGLARGGSRHAHGTARRHTVNLAMR